MPLFQRKNVTIRIDFGSNRQTMHNERSTTMKIPNLLLGRFFTNKNIKTKLPISKIYKFP